MWVEASYTILNCIDIIYKLEIRPTSHSFCKNLFNEIMNMNALYKVLNNFSWCLFLTQIYRTGKILQAHRIFHYLFILDFPLLILPINNNKIRRYMSPFHSRISTTQFQFTSLQLPFTSAVCDLTQRGSGQRSSMMYGQKIQWVFK